MTFKTYLYRLHLFYLKLIYLHYLFLFESQHTKEKYNTISKQVKSYLDHACSSNLHRYADNASTWPRDSETTASIMMLLVTPSVQFYGLVTTSLSTMFTRCLKTHIKKISITLNDTKSSFLCGTLDVNLFKRVEICFMLRCPCSFVKYF